MANGSLLVFFACVNRIRGLIIIIIILYIANIFCFETTKMVIH